MTERATQWTQAQVDALNSHQRDRRFHPYTCPGGYEACENHRSLIATPDGWVCACGRYTQKWAHDMPDLREHQPREVGND
jgi:hypothetical protein